MEEERQKATFQEAKEGDPIFMDVEQALDAEANLCHIRDGWGKCLIKRNLERRTSPHS